MSFRRPAVLAALALLALHAVGTAVAVSANWPAQFGGVGADAKAEWITRGTALSAPLAPLVVLGVATVLASLRGWVSRVGGALVVLLALLFMVGALGEAFAPATEDVSKAVLVTSGVLGLMMAGAVLVVVSAGSLRRPMARRSARPAANRAGRLVSRSASRTNR